MLLFIYYFRDLKIEETNHPLTFDMARLSLSKTSEIPGISHDDSDSNCSTSSGPRKSSRQKNVVEYSDPNLHKIKRRTIARPKKIISVDSSEKDIGKFYLSINKKKSVKSTNLETIFEEAFDEKAEEQDSNDGETSNCSINISGDTKMTGRIERG